jgi:hypothetical protein
MDDLTPIECAEWLKGKVVNVHSQFGEDGLLAAIFDRIGTTNKWCFEIGAADGITFSNVRELIRREWHAVLIEKDVSLYAALKANYAPNTLVYSQCGYIEPWSADAMLETLGYPIDGDLGVLDIDEQEFWVWAGMRRIRPRVMVVEYGLGRPIDQLPPLRVDGGQPIPAIQGGRNMIHYLGVCKGYRCVAVTQCNMLFVLDEILAAIA